MEKFGELCYGLTDEMHKDAIRLSEAQEDEKKASKRPKVRYFSA